MLQNPKNLIRGSPEREGSQEGSRVSSLFPVFPERPPESLMHSSIQFLRDPGHRHRGALPQLPRERNLVGMPFREPPELIQFHPGTAPFFMLP